MGLRVCLFGPRIECHNCVFFQAVSCLVFQLKMDIKFGQTFLKLADHSLAHSANPLLTHTNDVHTFQIRFAYSALRFDKYRKPS